MPRKFVAEKTGGDADAAVVAADVIGADQRRGDGEQMLRAAEADGFAENQEAGVVVEAPAERAQELRCELVQYHVADHRGIARPAGERFQVGLMPDAIGGPAVRRGPAVESVNPESMAGEPVGEFSEARAEFEHGGGRLDEGRERAGEPVRVAHETVDQAQVPPVVESVGMPGRQRIEQFGFEAAFHGQRMHRREGSVKRRRASDSARDGVGKIASLPRGVRARCRHEDPLCG